MTDLNARAVEGDTDLNHDNCGGCGMNASKDTPEGWQWWGGVDEEVCTYGPCATKEEVIAEAVADGLGEFQAEDGGWKIGVHVCEARKDPLRLADWIAEAEDVLERAEESVADSDRASEYNDDPFFECTKEQQADLERRLKAACDDWQTSHGLVFNTWTFSASRNHEYVVVDRHGSAEAAP